VLFGTPQLSVPFAVESHIYRLDQIGILRKADFLGAANTHVEAVFTPVAEDAFFQIAHDNQISIVRYFESLPVITGRGPVFVRISASFEKGI
jgi:hypothetical protein